MKDKSQLEYQAGDTEGDFQQDAQQQRQQEQQQVPDRDEKAEAADEDSVENASQKGDEINEDTSDKYEDRQFAGPQVGSKPTKSPKQKSSCWCLSSAGRLLQSGWSVFQHALQSFIVSTNPDPL